MQPRISRGGILELFTKIAFAAALLVLILAVPSVSAPLPPGGTTYLSNLQWASATNGWGPVERDMSNGETAARDGKAITLNGATYAKGLGVHATSDLRYNLGGNYDVFTAKVGVDDEVGANGSVTFEVWADGTKVYDSGIMRGDTVTKDVSVDVTGKNELRLVVTTGGNDNGYDHADWADAKLHAAATYLSDLSWISATNGWGPVERDMSNGETAARDGKAITLNGATYAKGLGVHATSDLRYNLGGNYDVFTAKVGVDDEVGANGSVTFEVWADGTKVYDSGIMRGDTVTKDVSVDVTGKNELRLVVTTGGNDNGYDHADWADAKLHAASQQEPPPPSPSSSERKVFAHYMLAYYAYSNPPTVADMKREIQLAQANGIDGFALNAGSWRNEPHYVSRADTMYQAATELGSGFKLYFSADMCCILGDHPEWVREMVTRYYDSPAQYKVGGKPVLSTFGGEDTTFGQPSVQQGWQTQVLNPLAFAGKPVVFIPNFFGGSEHPSQWNIINTYDAHGSYIDGIYYYSALARGREGVAPAVASNHAYALESRARGGYFMAGGTSYYWQDVNGNNRVAGDYSGYAGMADIWQGIISDAPPFVEWVTWNDYGETSYIGPVSGNSVQKAHGVSDMPHNGYLELMKYYAHWYKTGQRPAITQDKLFYAYRPHSKNATASNPPIGKPANWDTLNDRLYVTAMLEQPATVRLITGGISADFALGAGIHEVSVPFNAGSQRVELRRGGSPVFGETGTKQINNTITAYNFNHYADSVMEP